MNYDSFPIDRTELSVRSKNALHRVGVHTVGDMLGYSEDQLREVRNLGSKSIEEILAAIQKYSTSDVGSDCLAEDSFVEDIPDISLDKLVSLSAKEYNLLSMNGCHNLRQVLQLTEAGLLSLPCMDSISAKRIYSVCWQYAKNQGTASAARATHIDVVALRLDPLYHDVLLSYAKANDIKLAELQLSARPLGRLSNAGYENLSDILFLTQSELLLIPSMGTKSAVEVLECLNSYLLTNEADIRAVIGGDTSTLLSDRSLRQKILSLYVDAWFEGFSFSDFSERIPLPGGVDDTRLKKAIGGMIADGSLEYVDYRCYRVYPSFASQLEQPSVVRERNRDILLARLEGKHLNDIGKEYNLSRERIFQIINKNAKKIREEYKAISGADVFDEDYYQYFFSTYDFDEKTGAEWFGISAQTFNYLTMEDLDRSKTSLDTALNDTRLNASLRLKIKNYLNRNKIFIDGIWVEKSRGALEQIAVKKLCRDTVSFEKFCDLYNRFLEQNDIAFDEDLYYTDDVKRARESKLANARFLLWKQYKQLRYYDIDEQDYSELFDALGLESLENIELSTLKIFEDYPQLMEEYDIRDHYELHNLLRKTVPEGSYHDFRCGKMPIIAFGKFDRDAALFRLLSDNAPISAKDLADLIHKEYGYEQSTTLATYLQPLSMYYHQGYYTVDQKEMPPENRALLSSRLTEDFYYIDELRQLYRDLIPGADEEEINPYNLKQLGFSVYSRYAIQNFPSLEAYFTDLLTKDKIVDLSPYRNRFSYVGMFSQTLWTLKRNLTVVELEPNRLIRFRDLEAAGLFADDVQEFCDAVYGFVETDSYFTIASIKAGGFTSALFDLGFSDWFYANLLISDVRFTFKIVFGNIVFSSSGSVFSAGDMLQSIIAGLESINVSDFVLLLTEKYGFHISDRWDVTEKLHGTPVYHDKMLDRLYADNELYYRELGI